jgi:hypothetical protein
MRITVTARGEELAHPHLAPSEVATIRVFLAVPHVTAFMQSPPY